MCTCVCVCGRGGCVVTIGVCVFVLGGGHVCSEKIFSGETNPSTLPLMITHTTTYNNKKYVTPLPKSITPRRRCVKIFWDGHHSTPPPRETDALFACFLLVSCLFLACLFASLLTVLVAFELLAYSLVSFASCLLLVCFLLAYMLFLARIACFMRASCLRFCDFL